MVVTGMRACGLRDYRNGRAKTVPSGGAEEDCDRSRERDGEREKEEYKQVYHHTSKAAAFTFVRLTYPLFFYIYMTRANCVIAECNLGGHCRCGEDEGGRG